MTSFRYRAYSAGGRIVQGVIVADSEAEALGLLHGKGITPFFASESSGGTGAGKRRMRSLSLADRSRLAGQIATLLQAELPIDQALRLVEQQAPSKAARKVVQGVIAAVADGGVPSAALFADGRGFAADEASLIKAGEQSGSLAGVFSELAAMLAARAALRDKIASALLYPLILLAMAALAIFIVATVLVPNIAPLFEQSGAELPLIVRILDGAGSFINNYGAAVLAAAALAGALCWTAFRSPGVRRRIDRAILHLPLIGPFARRAEAARVCRTLGVLLRSGARLQPALAAVREVARNAATREALGKAIEGVVGGKKLAPALADVAALDQVSRQMIAIGEEANRLEHMLLNTATINEAELEKRIERFMTLLTPVLTILLGALVGGLIISVMQAILGVNEMAVP